MTPTPVPRDSWPPLRTGCHTLVNAMHIMHHKTDAQVVRTLATVKIRV